MKHVTTVVSMCCTLLAGVANAPSATAAQMPVPSTVDSTSGSFNYLAGDRYIVTVYSGAAVTVVLPEEEVIMTEDPLVGAPHVYELQVVPPNRLAIRALGSVGRANLTIITEHVQSEVQRMYQFDLIVKASPENYHEGGDLPQDMLWTVTMDEGTKKRGKASQPIAYRTPQMAPQRNNTRIPVARKVKKRDKNMRYGLLPDSTVSPVYDGVFDNGTFTFLEFPEHSDLPTISRIDREGIERLVNVRSDAHNTNVLIVEGVYPVLTLRDGEREGCVINMKLAPSRLRNSTPTVSRDERAREVKSGGNRFTSFFANASSRSKPDDNLFME